jgi:hypothetical protein
MKTIPNNKIECCDIYVGQKHHPSCRHNRQYWCCGMRVRPGDRCPVCGELMDNEEIELWGAAGQLLKEEGGSP